MAAFSTTKRAYQADQIMSTRVIALLTAVVAGVAAVRGSVPIIVSAGAGRRAAGNLCNKANNQVDNDDLAGAKRNVNAALHMDPEFWPALYEHARIYAKQGRYQVALADCNGALRKYPEFVEASLLRASINAHLGKYARKHQRSLIILFRSTLDGLLWQER
jgi:tetratricopeptide (TPR) repeat protein